MYVDGLGDTSLSYPGTDTNDGQANEHHREHLEALPETSYPLA